MVDSEIDSEVLNAQCWYPFPIHLAVYAGCAEIVRLLLDHGADPGQSIYTYNSWDKLLHCAKERGNRPIEVICGAQADPSQAQRLRRMIAFLLKRGAATNLLGDEPWATPLAWANRHDNSNLVDLLENHGST